MSLKDFANGVTRRDLLKAAGAGAATIAAIGGLPGEATAYPFPEPTLPAEE